MYTNRINLYREIAMKTIHLKFAALAVASIWALSSCQEHIEESARFTFVGNTVASYLEKNEEFSSFVDILRRGDNCLALMKAYGEYTCFAPTNEAVAQYVKEQHALYLELVESNPDYEVTSTDVVSDDPKELTPEKCAEIAKNHIIATKFLGVELIGNQIPAANMNDRYLTLEPDTIDGKGVLLINSEAPVLYEEEVENGIVHVISKVVSPSNIGIAGQIGAYNYFDLFFEALEKTGYSKFLTATEDPTYDEANKMAKGHPDGLPQAPYPASRYMGFTAFIEPDTVLKDAGINTFDDLVKACQAWYPEGTLVWSTTKNKDGNREEGKIDFSMPLDDWRNPVNQFVGYHLLDRKVPYDYLVCYNIDVTNFKSEEDFPNNADRIEYYEMMNGKILKVTMPRSEDKASIYLNYMNHKRIGMGQNIEVYAPNDFKLKDAAYESFNQEALNGSLNVIGDILTYDENIMKSRVLYCVMRFDVASLCSEFTNNNIRWRPHNPNSGPGEVFIPHRYCENVKVYTDDTRLFYLSPHHSWHNYQGDEMSTIGLFDFAYRLPPLPAGTYEIRLGYSASLERHLVQVYLDNQVTGIPIDLRITGDKPQIGWRPDGDDMEAGGVTLAGLKNDPEAIAANDKDMKNRGYLKGPTTFFDDKKGSLARNNPLNLRAVIATKQLSEGSHWLRFKNVNEADEGSAEFMHDYFEIVPVGYLRDENIEEAEKRQ
jgi:uncharacterized surface protein with fasciclin (FAS1) repeats